LKDGLVMDPTGCRFDVKTIECPGEKKDGCLSTAQVSAIQQAFAGPRDSKGRQVYPGFLFDTGITTTEGLPGLLAGAVNPIGPAYTATEMDVDARAEQASADPQMILTATSTWTNLNTFSARGGKLLFYHGASDPWFSALDTLDYYERMGRANGGAVAVMGWSRRVPRPGHGPLRRWPDGTRDVRHAGRDRRLGGAREGACVNHRHRPRAAGPDASALSLPAARAIQRKRKPGRGLVVRVPRAIHPMMDACHNPSGSATIRPVTSSAT
jgi:hypothetical protein